MWRYLFIVSISILFCSRMAATDLGEILSQKVSPNFVGTSLQEVLRVFSRQYSLNLVMGDEVEGRVTIQLENVSLGEALNAILKSNGYHYIVENDVIIVKPYESTMNGELQTKVFFLKYLDGFSLLPTLTPLLSAKGKMEALASEREREPENLRSDLLVVTDLWENVREMEQVIATIDVPRPQLQIEVRLIETLIGNEKQVGINFPKSVDVSVTGGETSAPVSGSQGNNNQQQRKLAGWYKLPELNDNFTWGVLTVDELQASLDLLAKDNNSRLVSNPKVTTLNNKKALIRVGTTVPIQEVSRGISGDLITFKEKEVNMNLLVIPRINENGKITMMVHPILEEIVGYTGPSDFPQPITSKREVQTTVTVKNGETLVIGGLIKESTSKTVEKIWLLGDIPILGYLFRHTSTKKEKSDLLIFITPKIMEDPNN